MTRERKEEIVDEVMEQMSVSKRIKIVIIIMKRVSGRAKIKK